MGVLNGKVTVVTGAGRDMYLVNKSGTVWPSELTDTFAATALLPGVSIIVPCRL